VNQACHLGSTALHMAAQEGHVEVVRALLAAGADLNRTTSHGSTRLAAARANNHEAAALALVHAELPLTYAE